MKNGTKKKTNGTSPAQAPTNARPQIEKRAYELWLADGGCSGNDMHYWLQAEREVTTIHASQPGTFSNKIQS